MTGTNPSKPISVIVEEALDRIKHEPLIGILDTDTARLALKNELLALSLEVFASAKDSALAALAATVGDVERVKNGKL